MKMKIFFGAILILFLFQPNLFPLITSRIEGKVVDDETGEPVVGAEVFLAHDRRKVNLTKEIGNRIIPYEWIKKTDRNGYFRYDDLIKSEYFLCIEKEGYTTVGPFRKELEGRSDLPIWERRSIRDIEPGTKGIIYLKEGEIKYFEIKLARESTLEIRYILKTHKGVGLLPALRTSAKKSKRPSFPFNIGADLYSEDLEQNVSYRSLMACLGMSPTSKEAGLARFENLPGGITGRVEVRAMGYPGKTYEFQLEKGKTTIIEHILDYTKGPVIYGVIKKKNTGEVFDNLPIYLYDSHNNKIRTETDYKGEYWLGGFMHGNIKMSIYDTTLGIDDNHYLNLGLNEIREMNFEY